LKSKSLSAVTKRFNIKNHNAKKLFQITISNQLISYLSQHCSLARTVTMVIFSARQRRDKCVLKFLAFWLQVQQDAQLSQRDRAAVCVIVFAKSRTLELGDNDLWTL